MNILTYIFHSDISSVFTFLNVSIDNNEPDGWTGRYGFIRVWGGYVSPVWLNADSSGNPIPLETKDGSNNLTTLSYKVPIIIPGEGTREFMAELLDENFTVIAQSDKKTIGVTDSGKEPPPDYDEDAGGQGESDNIF